MNRPVYVCMMIFYACVGGKLKVVDERMFAANMCMHHLELSTGLYSGVNCMFAPNWPCNTRKSACSIELSLRAEVLLSTRDGSATLYLYSMGCQHG